MNTDARTSIPTTIRNEIATLTDAFSWDEDRIVTAQLAAADAAFIEPDQRRHLRNQILAAAP